MHAVVQWIRFKLNLFLNQSKQTFFIMQLLTVTQYMTVLKNKKEVTEHLKNGKDFLIQDMSCKWDNKICNKTEVLRANYSHIKVYYGKNNAKMTVIEL